MKVKIFLGQYTYIYHGNIDLQEMNEFVKTLTNKVFIIKWKDQEDDLITILKKGDLLYFYQQWSQYQAINKQSFKLYVHEIPLINQNTQITQLQSQSHIQTKMYSPFSRQSDSKQQYQGQGISQFNFNLLLNEQVKSQEFIKERYSQQINLQQIVEVQGSSGKNQRILYDFNNVYAQDLSFFMNMDMKQSIHKKEFPEISIAFDDDINELDDSNDVELFDNTNIYCDYCSDKIQCNDELSIIYTCQICEDFHTCKLCFDQYQEQVHIHQLQENILQ